mgnify:FL=1
MQQKFEKIRDLLVREKWDELTADERQMLEEWRQEEESHEQLYRRLAEPGALRRHFDELAAVDTERALAYNRKLLQRYALRRVVRWSLPYAAVVAIVAGVWLLFPRTESQPRVTETIEKIEPGIRRAELVLADGSAVELLPDMQKTLESEQEKVVIAGNTVDYTGSDENSMPVSQHLIRTPCGGEYSLTLADGTKVWLNAMSELKYPTRFNGNTRCVELKGEAFFEVKPDAQRPFYVKIDNYEVKVLGTSFNVKAYDDDDSWATTLCIGKVEMTDVHTRESIELLPGRQAVCDRQTGNVEVKEVDILPYVTWKEGHFLFKNQSLEKIMDIMARWYDVSVEFQDESIRNLHFTGDIKRHANFSIILKALTSSVNVNYKLNGRELILYMK